MSKKQLIMEKASELFAKHGFEATSVQQITEYCGISKGAFYLSFKSKDELIFSMIDYFLLEITTDIDQLVKNSDFTTLLHDFYYQMFQSFQKHSDLAKVLIKEQSHSLNKEIFIKTRIYDIKMDEAILLMINKLYKEKVKDTKYDLLYCIKGFLRIHSELFLFYNLDLNLNQLCDSLVEKTNILAAHTSMPFITEDLTFYLKNSERNAESQEDLLKLIQQKWNEVDDTVVKESLKLIEKDFPAPSFPPAIRKGLIENIRKHPQGKWLALLLDQYYGE
ncbi:TetR/AcrR family transcriptional regulator [Sutcliffiella rhizosphaerae]|uniref:HTH tetR-type domain-containing protein n=1 Tax=Sutcliffiella rhizosphaerae TaxID=2880967 RepID=A0ABN8A8L9_9BACI|nr:TetR/AcrR family transcriptional regulator [Sutcliffiella rhizosphaerae]CAG9621504.1 hypothetical protein BACCIP111883_02277 [Sutcliffiella rhizosphaerae]